MTGNISGTTLAAEVKEATRIAIAEAKNLNSVQVHPEHILLGLMRSNKGVASGRLKNAGITPEIIYVELIKSFNQPYNQPQPSERPIN